MTSESAAKSFSRTSTESEAWAAGCCLASDPLGLRDDASSDVVESLDIKERDEPLGEGPCRCDVI